MFGDSGMTQHRLPRISYPVFPINGMPRCLSIYRANPPMHTSPFAEGSMKLCRGERGKSISYLGMPFGECGNYVCESIY